MLREGRRLTEFSDDLFFFIVERPYGHILRGLQFRGLQFRGLVLAQEIATAEDGLPHRPLRVKRPRERHIRSLDAKIHAGIADLIKSRDGQQFRRIRILRQMFPAFVPDLFHRIVDKLRQIRCGADQVIAETRHEAGVDDSAVGVFDRAISDQHMRAVARRAAENREVRSEQEERNITVTIERAYLR